MTCRVDGDSFRSHAEMLASVDMNADWLSVAPGCRDRGQAASEVERSRAPVDPGGRGSRLETARGRKVSWRATAEITSHRLLDRRLIFKLQTKRFDNRNNATASFKAELQSAWKHFNWIKMYQN